MPESSNVAVARRLYDSRADPAVAKKIIAPDVVWDITPGFPNGGVYKGYDSMMQDFFAPLLPRFDSFHAEAERYYEDEDDHVFVVGHYHAATKTNPEIRVRFVHLWTIRDGKLARLQQTADSAVLVAALANL